jgi:hypothetical protein
VALHTTLPRDDKECRLFGAYEVSSAKEHAAAIKLLIPHHGLSDQAYLKLLGELQAIRAECNEAMLAIIAHHKSIDVGNWTVMPITWAGKVCR